METCRIEGCDRPIHVKGERLCVKHYTAFNRHGDPLAWKKSKRNTCEVDGCEGKVHGNGMCAPHYWRMKRYGILEPLERPTICAVGGCDGAIAAKGLCDTHYRRARKFGDPGPRHCVMCGKDVGGKGRTVYCSKQCSMVSNFWSNKDSMRKNMLDRLYDLTPADYEAMIAAQDGKCLICQGTEVKTNGSTHWAIDHDHETGEVRGLLCGDCNLMLGNAHDDPDLLIRAAAYLRGELAPV